jgi:UDP-N-acetylmuramoyl-tripeptide--D-alanyl-D-alanine ligase
MTSGCATLAAVTNDEPSPGLGAPEPRSGAGSFAPGPREPGSRPGSPAGLTMDDLLAATGGALLRAGDRMVRGAAVDSRLVEPGNLFVALPGDHTDGHRYLGQAVAAGAAALLVARPPDPTAGEPPLAELGEVSVLQVADPLRGLGAVASAWRARFEALVVGITGSIAKTSTKEAVAAVLEQRFETLRSEGNQNNEIGLPLTVMRLDAGHGAAVLEMGMYVGGEIRDLAAIGRPSIGVVTAVQPVHLSRIGSLDAIEDAKAELVEALPSARNGGVAVLNADDPRVRRMADRTAARVVTYGLEPGADVTADQVESHGFAGMGFTLVTPAGRASATVRGLGRLAVHNALAAAAVGLAAGLDLATIVPGLAASAPAPHRSTVIRVGAVTLIDDAYNASPGSVRAALDVLAGLPGRRVAILGQMLELGSESTAGHREAGTAAAEVADLLIVVAGGPGGGAAAIADGARAAGLPPDRIVRATDRAQALAEAEARIRAGDIVLVKASRGLGMEEPERNRLGVGLEILIDELVRHLGGAEGADRGAKGADRGAEGADRGAGDGANGNHGRSDDGAAAGR